MKKHLLTGLLLSGSVITTTEAKIPENSNSQLTFEATDNTFVVRAKTPKYSTLESTATTIGNTLYKEWVKPVKTMVNDYRSLGGELSKKYNLSAKKLMFHGAIMAGVTYMLLQPSTVVNTVAPLMIDAVNSTSTALVPVANTASTGVSQSISTVGVTALTALTATAPSLPRFSLFSTPSADGQVSLTTPTELKVEAQKMPPQVTMHPDVRVAVKRVSAPKVAAPDIPVQLTMHPVHVDSVVVQTVQAVVNAAPELTHVTIHPDVADVAVVDVSVVTGVTAPKMNTVDAPKSDVSVADVTETVGSELVSVGSVQVDPRVVFNTFELFKNIHTAGINLGSVLRYADLLKSGDELGVVPASDTVALEVAKKVVDLAKNGTISEEALDHMVKVATQETQPATQGWGSWLGDITGVNNIVGGVKRIASEGLFGKASKSVEATEVADLDTTDYSLNEVQLHPAEGSASVAEKSVTDAADYSLNEVQLHPAKGSVSVRRVSFAPKVVTPKIPAQVTMHPDVRVAVKGVSAPKVAAPDMPVQLTMHPVHVDSVVVQTVQAVVNAAPELTHVTIHPDVADVAVVDVSVVTGVTAPKMNTVDAPKSDVSVADVTETVGSELVSVGSVQVDPRVVFNTFELFKNIHTAGINLGSVLRYADLLKSGDELGVVPASDTVALEVAKKVVDLAKNGTISEEALDHMVKVATQETQPATQGWGSWLGDITGVNNIVGGVKRIASEGFFGKASEPIEASVVSVGEAKVSVTAPSLPTEVMLHPETSAVEMSKALIAVGKVQDNSTKVFFDPKNPLAKYVVWKSEGGQDVVTALKKTDLPTGGYEVATGMGEIQLVSQPTPTVLEPTVDVPVMNTAVMHPAKGAVSVGEAKVSVTAPSLPAEVVLHPETSAVEMSKALVAVGKVQDNSAKVFFDPKNPLAKYVVWKNEGGQDVVTALKKTDLPTGGYEVATGMGEIQLVSQPTPTVLEPTVDVPVMNTAVMHPAKGAVSVGEAKVSVTAPSLPAEVVLHPETSKVEMSQALVAVGKVQDNSTKVMVDPKHPMMKYVVWKNEGGQDVVTVLKKTDLPTGEYEVATGMGEIQLVSQPTPTVLEPTVDVPVMNTAVMHPARGAVSVGEAKVSVTAPSLPTEVVLHPETSAVEMSKALVAVGKVQDNSTKVFFDPKNPLAKYVVWKSEGGQDVVTALKKIDLPTGGYEVATGMGEIQLVSQPTPTVLEPTVDVPVMNTAVMHPAKGAVSVGEAKVSVTAPSLPAEVVLHPETSAVEMSKALVAVGKVQDNSAKVFFDPKNPLAKYVVWKNEGGQDVVTALKKTDLPTGGYEVATGMGEIQLVSQPTPTVLEPTVDVPVMNTAVMHPAKGAVSVGEAKVSVTAPSLSTEVVLHPETSAVEMSKALVAVGKVQDNSAKVFFDPKNPLAKYVVWKNEGGQDVVTALKKTDLPTGGYEVATGMGEIRLLPSTQPAVDTVFTPASHVDLPDVNRFVWQAGNPEVPAYNLHQTKAPNFSIQVVEGTDVAVGFTAGDVAAVDIKVATSYPNCSVADRPDMTGVTPAKFAAVAQDTAQAQTVEEVKPEQSAVKKSGGWGSWLGDITGVNDILKGFERAKEEGFLGK